MQWSLLEKNFKDDTIFALRSMFIFSLEKSGRGVGVGGPITADQGRTMQLHAWPRPHDDENGSWGEGGGGEG
jgi:hypothetical protein